MSYLKEIQKYDFYQEIKMFMGQSVVYPGSSIFVSLKMFLIQKLNPVMEETQTGMAIGMALAGYIPVSCYPRFDFLIFANQLVNHLDKIDYLTNNNFDSKIIIRTMVGSTLSFECRTAAHSRPYNCIERINEIFRSHQTKNKNQIFLKYKNA